MTERTIKRIVALSEAGQKLYLARNYAKAMECFNEILSISPKLAKARAMRAIILSDTGHGAEALEESRKALEDLSPPSAQAYNNHGVICKRLNMLEEAMEAYAKALEISPGDNNVRANLGSLYILHNKLDEAERLLLEDVKMEDNPAYWLNLARICLLRKDHEKAGHYLARAEEIDPFHPAIGLIRGAIALQDNEEEKAFQLVVEALQHNVAQIEGWAVLRTVQTANLRIEELEKLLSRVIETGTELPQILSAAVALSRHNLAWNFLSELESRLQKVLHKNRNLMFNASTYFDLLGCHVSQIAHKHAAQGAWRTLYGAVKVNKPQMAPYNGERKIKVGFLSSDFRNHAMSYLIAGVLENLPGGRIEWLAYSTTPDDSSPIRRRVARTFDKFIDAAKLEDAELNARLRADGIDILVDLNGMTRDNRSGALASKAAPIHAQWIGMPGSMGAEGVADYILGDRWASPAWLAEGFTEKIIQLPRSYFPADHDMPDYTLAGDRGDHCLPENAFVFCCFNQYYKFSPETFAMWGEIMRQVPGSALWLMQPAAEWIKERLYALLKAEGIDPERIVFAPFTVQARHIARISHADLILDTLPYNAHTTTVDALRAGAPVLTLPGETYAGRVAASILHTGGLDEWIVDSPEEYVKKAIDYALLDRDKREKIREDVYDRYIKSPMLDNKAFGKVLEDLFIGLAEREAAGLPPAAMRLTEEGDLVPLAEGSEDGETPRPAWMRN